MRSITRFAVLICVASLLAACGDKDRTGGNGAGDADEAALPAPEAGTGSVTGMPDKPGPGQVAAVTGEPPPTIVPGTEEPPIDLLNPETGLLPGGGEAAVADGSSVPADGATQEPSPEDAVAVLRDYYASINARSFARAYSLWSDGGRSSGQSPQQFADGYAETAGVTVQIATPGAIDAAAGSRFVTIPVAITATRRDGSVHRYDGTFTLRRAVVDGATDEQRAWRIHSADLRELQP
jgi:hypothetical protein